MPGAYTKDLTPWQIVLHTLLHYLTSSSSIPNVPFFHHGRGWRSFFRIPEQNIFCTSSGPFLQLSRLHATHERHRLWKHLPRAPKDDQWVCPHHDRNETLMKKSGNWREQLEIRSCDTPFSFVFVPNYDWMSSSKQDEHTTDTDDIEFSTRRKPTDVDCTLTALPKFHPGRNGHKGNVCRQAIPSHVHLYQLLNKPCMPAEATHEQKE